MIGVNELAVVDEPYRTPCRAVMLTCVDYRFLRPACDLLEREGLLGSTDLIAWPGGAMALRSEDAGALLSALELAVTRHAPPTMLLVAHMGGQVKAISVLLSRVLWMSWRKGWQDWLEPAPL